MEEPQFKSYLMYVKAHIPEMTSAHITEKQAEFVARQKWNAMNKKEKDAYAQMDNTQYVNSNQTVKPAEAEPQFVNVKPKRPLTSFMFFAHSRAAELSKSEGISYKDAIKKCGELWGKMSDEEKLPWNNLT